MVGSEIEHQGYLSLVTPDLSWNTQFYSMWLIIELSSVTVLQYVLLLIVLFGIALGDGGVYIKYTNILSIL